MSDQNPWVIRAGSIFAGQITADARPSEEMGFSKLAHITQASGWHPASAAALRDALDAAFTEMRFSADRGARVVFSIAQMIASNRLDRTLILPIIEDIGAGHELALAAGCATQEELWRAAMTPETSADEALWLRFAANLALMLARR